MRILFLDDDLTRRELFFRWSYGFGHDVTIVTSAHAAIRSLDAFPRYDLVFLDHDLEDDHYAAHRVGRPLKGIGGTGEEVARWLAGHPDKHPREAVVHSWNMPAGQRMTVRLLEAGIPTRRQVFGPTVRDYVQQLPADPEVFVPYRRRHVKDLVDSWLIGPQQSTVDVARVLEEAERQVVAAVAVPAELLRGDLHPRTPGQLGPAPREGVEVAPVDDPGV